MNEEKLKYAILKRVDDNKKEFDHTTFGISKEQFDDEMRYLQRNRYVGGILFADDEAYSYQHTIYIEPKGEVFLKENSKLAKSYRVAKEIREWIKL